MRFTDEVPVISVCESVSCGTIVFEWDRESPIGVYRRCWWSIVLWWVINHWPSFKFSFSCVFKLLITILFELWYCVFNPINSSCYLRFTLKLHVFRKCFKKCIYQYILLYIVKSTRFWILIDAYRIHSVYYVTYVLTTFLMWNWCSFLMVTLYKCIALYCRTFLKK